MNENKFTDKARIYAKYRPSYPQSFLDYLYSEAGFSASSTIADIGAGTGILSALLAARGSAVHCVEPNHDMLGQAKLNLAGYASCSFIQASAERTTLESASVDYVTVAQAFHWFDRDRFRLECQRILRTNGKVVLVWNSRGASDTLTLETAKVNRQLCPAFKGFSGGSDQSPEAYADFFRNGAYEYRGFANDLSVDEQTFLGRNLSASYAPKEGEENYAPYVQAMRGLFGSHSKDGIVKMRNITRSYTGNV